MKKITIIAIAFFMLTGLNAQSFLGAQVGYNHSSIFGSATNGFNLGLTTVADMKNFGLLYSMNLNYDKGDIKNFDFSITQLRQTLMITKNDPLLVGIGLYQSTNFLTNFEQEGKIFKSPVGEVKSFDAGVSVLIGYITKYVMVDIRLSQGFIEAYSDFLNSSFSFNLTIPIKNF